MRHHWFFDFDGTLADTDRDVRDAWRAAIADAGLVCDDFDARFQNGPPIDAVLQALFPGRVTPAVVADVRARFVAHYDGGGFPHTRAYPGVDAFLRRLAAAGVHVHVASNKRIRPLRLLVAQLGWADLVESIHAPDAVPGAKLTKAAFLARALAEGGIAPDDAVMAGDTRGDVEAGRANGMFTVGCTWGYGPREGVAGADRVLALDELGQGAGEGF